MAHHPMNKKNTFWGGLLLQRTKREKSIFWKKNIWSNFLKKIFCPPDAEFFPDSKMVLLFEFCPKLADLRRIKVFTFENERFPLFRSECLWNTLRGEKWSKNGTNDVYWTYNEGVWWNWAQKKFEISKCLIIQIQSHKGCKTDCNNFDQREDFMEYWGSMTLIVPRQGRLVLG